MLILSRSWIRGAARLGPQRGASGTEQSPAADAAGKRGIT